MATYTKETALYDTGKIGTDILSAGQTASKYITAVDQNGIKVHAENNPTTTYTKIDGTGMEVYQNVSGTATKVASFGKDGATIGTGGNSHLNMDYHSMQLIDKEGSTYFYVSDLRTDHTSSEEFGAGFYYVVTETFVADGDAYDFYLGFEAMTTSYSVKVNDVELTNVTKYVRSISFDPDDGDPPAQGTELVVKYPTASAEAKAYTLGLRNTTNPVGGMSVAEGKNTSASGTDSHAEGYATIAGAFGSHAEGSNTKANGDVSHAEGGYTIASGSYSHVEGYKSKATASYSHAEGWETEATDRSSHAEGYGTKASGYYSHAEGRGTEATNWQAHAEGFGSKATGPTSHAEGRDTTAGGTASHAEGYGTTTNGSSSHAEGSGTIAYGSYSHAEGWDTITRQDASHAEGRETEATSQYAHAEGNNSKATASASHAEGIYTTASAAGSHAQNEYTIANRNAQTVIGTYNIEDPSSTTTTHPNGQNYLYGKYALIIGNGTGSSNRSNALAVDWVGNVTINNHTSPIGTIKTASLSSNLSVANNTSVYGNVEISLDAGVWVVTAGARFATNATGHRQMNIQTSKAASDIQLTAMGHPTQYCQMVYTVILGVASDNTKYYLNVRQTSGGSLNLLAGGTNWGTFITAVRIA